MTLCGTPVTVVAVWREQFGVKTTDCAEEDELSLIVMT
jgi:hypothetical protein